MGRLIKINNLDQTNGIINAYFQKSFLIPEKSKLSLHNISCKMEEATILIDNTNQTFRRKLAKKATVPFGDVTLRIGLYTVKDFLLELNRALNASLNNFRGVEQGFQFKVSMPDEKIKISFNRIKSTQTSYPLVSKTQWLDNMVEDGTNSFYKPNTAQNGWNSATVSRKFFTGGAGAFTCTRDQFMNDPIIIGLVDSSSKDFYDGNYDVNVYKFCLYSAQRTSGGLDHVYWYRYTDNDGSTFDVETTVQPGNHQIGLMLSGGKLIYYYNQNPNTIPVVNFIPANGRLFEFDWSFRESYYGMLSIYQQGTTVSNVNFWNDPYYQLTSTFEHYHNEAPEYNMSLEDLDNVTIDDEGNENVGGSVTSIVTITFNDSLRQILGFNANPPPSANATSGYFLANKKIEDVLLPHNMKIILDNLVIESYDNVVQQQQSILATISSITHDDGSFTHNEPFLLNVDLDNKYPINISELRLRLLNFKNELIKIKPNLTDITLIVS